MSQFSCHESRGGCILFTEFLLRKCKKSIPSIYINYVKRKSRLNQYYCCFRVPRMDHGYDFFFYFFFFYIQWEYCLLEEVQDFLIKKSISFYLPNPFFLSLHGEKFHHYFATLDTLIICFY